MEIRLGQLRAGASFTCDVKDAPAHLGLLLVVLACFFVLAPTAQAAINKPPNNLGLVGYWSMDDCRSTRATDLSGQGNHGTLSGFAYTGTSSNWLSGANAKRGCALAFDGTNDYVDVPYSSAMDFGTGDFTVSSWVKTSYTGDYQILFNRDNLESGDGILIYTHQTSGVVRVWVGGAALNGTINVADGRWHHVVLRRASGTIYIYVDGALDTQGSAAGNVNQSNNNVVRLGHWYLGTSYRFLGSLDEVRVYSRALGATEVRSLYNAGVAKVSGAGTEGVDDGLVGHWKLDDRSGTRALDSTRYANHGTLTNFALSGVSSNWASGYRGGALTFDGTDDYVTVPDASHLDITSAITLAAWIKPNGAAENGYIIAKNNSGNFPDGYALAFAGDSDRLQFLANDNCAGTNCYSDAVFTDDNTWVHVAVVANGSTATFYRNGVAAGTLSSTELPPANAIAVTLGNRTNGASAFTWFTGSIDDARIYNTALTEEQIKTLYTLGTTKPTLVNIASNRLTTGTNLASGLVGHWTFDGRYLNTTTARDTSGQANHGTLTNGPVPAQGKLGQALSFDGVNDRVIATDINALDGASAFTVGAWAKLSATTGANREIVSKYDGGSQGFILDWDETTGWRAYVMSGGFPRGYTGTAGYNAGQWYYVTLVYNGSLTGDANRLKIFIDGVQQSLTFVAGIPATNGSNSSNVEIGFATTLSSFNGSLDDVRIYNRALTATEVKQLYNLAR